MGSGVGVGVGWGAGEVAATPWGQILLELRRPVKLARSNQVQARELTTVVKGVITS